MQQALSTEKILEANVVMCDAEHNLINFKGTKVIFDAPYNQNCVCADHRVSTWKEFYELICSKEYTFAALKYLLNIT